MRSPWISLALLVGLALPASADTPVVSPLSRVGVIGASVSDGVGPGVPSLSSLLRAGIDRPAVVIDRANSHFGAAPLATTQRAVEQVREGQATLVIAADVFFWYAYRFSSQDEREAQLQQGLEALAALDCPLLVGTVPKLEAQHIPPQNQPSAEQLARLNQAILDWAGEREQVTVLPFDEILVAFKAGQPIELAGAPYQPDPKSLFQRDGIHLTVEGQSALAMLILDTVRELPQLDEGERAHVIRDLAGLREGGLALDRTKTAAQPTLRALKHQSRKADGGPVELARLQEVLAKQVSAEDVARAVTWLEGEGALTREGDALTPVDGVEPIRH